MFDFSKYKYLTIGLSISIILAGFIYTFKVNKGFAHSLDFDGGLRAVVHFPAKIQRTDIEKYFKEKDIESVTILLDKEKNNYQIDIGLGAIPKISEYNLKLKSNPAIKAIIEEAEKIQKPSSINELIFMISTDFQLQKGDVLSADQVGAVVGGELTSTGLTLLLSTLGIIILYVTFRFKFKFAIAAALALVHDILFAVAFIGFFQIKPSVPIIAALLTLLGYSINDTIVVFDRIRENSEGNLQRTFSSVINSSILQTLGRTVNTSVATLISIIAIIIGGAVELYDFAYVLTFGIIVGTYSSIFIAAPLLEIYDMVIKPKAS